MIKTLNIMSKYFFAILFVFFSIPPFLQAH